MHKVHGVEHKVSTNVGGILNPRTGSSIFNSSITQKYMCNYKSQDVGYECKTSHLKCYFLGIHYWTYSKDIVAFALSRRFL